MVDLDGLENDGFAITRPLSTPTEINHLLFVTGQSAKPDAGRGGVRDVMDSVPELHAIAEHPVVREIVERVLGAEAFVVRATFFDKTGSANWKVPWHQDETIAVRERRAVEGYGPWSMKSDVVHVQPPSHIMEN